MSLPNSKIKFKNDTDDAGRSLFGSLKSRLLVSITNIIKKYPAAILSDPSSPIGLNTNTAENILYNSDTHSTTFTIQSSLLYNPFDIVFSKPNSETIIQNNNDLLGYLISQAESGKKDWFGFSTQKITSLNLAFDIARNHADTMNPEQVVDYVVELNKQIFKKIIIGNLKNGN